MGSPSPLFYGVICYNQTTVVVPTQVTTPARCRRACPRQIVRENLQERPYIDKLKLPPVGARRVALRRRGGLDLDAVHKHVGLRLAVAAPRLELDERDRDEVAVSRDEHQIAAVREVVRALDVALAAAQRVLRRVCLEELGQLV